jgi:hypothetical protein
MARTRADVLAPLSLLKVVFPDPDLDPDDAAKTAPTTSQLQSFRREIEILAVVGEVLVCGL